MCCTCKVYFLLLDLLLLFFTVLVVSTSSIVITRFYIFFENINIKGASLLAVAKSMYCFVMFNSFYFRRDVCRKKPSD